jgi:hypothetical protein
MIFRPCSRLTYHDPVLILLQLHIVVCFLLFDEQARDAQPTLAHKMLEHIALAEFFGGFLVGVFVGYPGGCFIGCLVETRVTLQVKVFQLAFVAAGEKTFVVEEIPGLEQ